MKRLNVPQWISLFRIMMSPLALVYVSDCPHKSWIFLGLVFLSGLTDKIDGVIARSQNQTTYLGAIIDYTADKVFIITALIVLSVAGDLPLWITIVILYRELIVMGMRIFATHHKFKIESGMVGKAKTFFTFSAIFFTILQFEFAYYLFLICVVLTVYSFWDYARKFNQLVELHADAK